MRDKYLKLRTKLYKPFEIALPILLGLLVIGWFFFNEFDPEYFSTLHFTFESVLYVLMAFLLMLARDVGMMWRFRILTDKDLSWLQAFNINVLSEFTSAVTPAAIGGSSLVTVFLFKEGIDGGRSTFIMFLNLFLDELFFVIFCSIIIILIPLNGLFNSTSIIFAAFEVVFFGLYFTRLFWIIILFIGIFKRPNWIKEMLLLVFKLPFLNRWHTKINLITNNLVQTSVDFGNRNYWFWIKVFGITILTWSARFLVVNAIFMAFIPLNDHLLVFGRQIILWLVMAISPTPGGSGVSEYAFKEYYSDIFSSTSAIIFITFIWRLISYYFYLLLGVVIIPGWIKKNMSNK